MGLLSTPLSRALLLVAGVALARGGSSLSASAASQAVALLGASVFTGASFWTTFIAGIVMFKHLPSKEIFGNLQAKLFPAYFLTLSLTSGLAAAGAVAGWGGRGGSVKGTLVAVGASGLNLVLLEPLTTDAMYKRRAAATGGGPAAKAANKRFGALHGMSSLVNLVGLGGMVLHLVGVAGEL